LSWQTREIGPGERELFNGFIAGSPKGHVLQTYEWGEIKAATGWQPIRLLVSDHDRPVAAISILKRKLPFPGKSIFYTPRGPVLDLENRPLFDYLVQTVREVAGKHGAVFWKLDPDVPVENRSLIEYFQSRKFRALDTGKGFEGVQPRFVFRMDITPPREQLLADMEGKTRYNIRLAARKGVEVVRDCTRDHLAPFYEILRETAARDRFLIRSYKYFEVLWDHLVPAGMAKLFLARYQDQFIAGTLAFKLGDKAWYIYGASSNRFRSVMPNYLLQWTMIEWAKENGCVMYDFRGISGDLSEDNPLYGLYRFKKGFGGRFTEFAGEFDLVFQPFFYWLWTKGEPLYSRGVRKVVRWRKRGGGQKDENGPAGPAD
jgi:peptidoglycan pentaglycine glycine transferase (the first glycine)